MLLRVTLPAALAVLFLAAAATCALSYTHGKPKRRGSGHMLVATFNIHYIAPWQERMRWEKRREAVTEALRDADADIVAFQEMETFEGGAYNRENRQLAWLKARFPDYRFGSTGDSSRYPSTQPIMYRRQRFAHLDQGFFFFSETPDEIYSRSWDGRFPAFCSWSRFRDRVTGTRFYVYNVHFDAGSRLNRVKAAKLVTERIAERRHSDEAVIVLGDLNAPHYFKPARILQGSGLEMAETRGSTFHFYRGINVIPAIDHVLVSSELRAVESTVLRTQYRGTWPSDHYPVVVEINGRRRELTQE